MKKFKCIKECQFKCRPWKVGEIFQGEAANKHFKLVKSDKEPALIDGKPKRKRKAEKAQSMQVPKKGTETETVIIHGKEVDIEKSVEDEDNEPGGDMQPSSD